MATLGENLRSFLIDSPGVAAEFDDIELADVVLQNQIPQDAPIPRIWYQRSSQIADPDLAGNATMNESTWDIECLASKDDADKAIDIADQIKSVLNGYFGVFGDSSIQGAFVTDHDDDYIFKGLGSDDGTNVAALSVTIFST